MSPVPGSRRGTEGDESRGRCASTRTTGPCPETYIPYLTPILDEQYGIFLQKLVLNKL